MNVIIICGGLSTRLGEITKYSPKILLDIGGKSVLDWQLQHIASLGITDVVLAAGHLSDVLYQAVGEQYNGMYITYAIEKERLGTGGAIKHALSYVAQKNEPTLVLNGDILTTVSFVDMVSYLHPSSDGILLGTHVPDASTYGTLVFDDTYHLLSFKEKEGIALPGYINGGVYLFTPQAQRYFPDKTAFSIEYDVFPFMKDLFVYASDRPWIDVGVPDRLQYARDHVHEFLVG